MWRWPLAASVAVALSGVPLVAEQDAPVFRNGVELFLLRVQVRADRGLPLRALTATDFTVHVGSRRPPVLFAEQIHPSDEELRTFPYKEFKWPKDEQAAIYLLGIDPDDSDCRRVPNVDLTGKGVKARSVAWSPMPGCAPPGAKFSSR